MKLIVAVIALCSALIYEAQAGVILQPWSSTETSLFTNQAAAGSGWVGSTLTLNFGPITGFQTSAASSTTYRLPNFLPTNAIGMQFGVASSLLGLHQHWADIDIEGTGLPINPNEYVLERVATTLRSTQAITDWELYLIRQPFSPRIVLVDIPESTSGGITTVQVLFLQSLINSPALYIGFSADGVDSNNQRAPGSTTFSNVSWLICTFDCPESNLPGNGAGGGSVPEPATYTMLLAGLGLLGFTARRRKNIAL